MVLGLAFAGVTARVLLDDVAAGAPFGVSHLSSIAALVAALAAGHYVLPALRSGAVWPALLLATVFAGATAYVVVVSGARNAERAGDRAAIAAHVNGERARLVQARAEAEHILAPCPKGSGPGMEGVKCGLRAAEASECGSGKGRRCEGRSYSVRTYEAAIAGYNAQIAKLGPERSGGRSWAGAARVLASLPYVAASADAIEASMERLMPFASVVISELATLGFLAFAFGHARTVRGGRALAARARIVRQARKSAVPAPRTVRLSGNCPADRPVSGAGQSAPARVRLDRPSPRPKAEALADLLTMLALGQSVPAQQALADRWGRPRQTVSDWCREWEAAGQMPRRRVCGRQKSIAAAAA